MIPSLFFSSKKNKKKYKEYLDKYITVNPGITGLAAIEGYRGGTENLELMQKRLDSDIQYIESWAIWLDIKITFITFLHMITFSTSAH